jgi:hypothetical protein
MSAAAATIAPAAIEDAIANVVRLSAQLTASAEHSIAALRDRDRNGLAAAAQEATALAKSYEANVRALAAAGPLPEADRAKLAASASALRAALAPHERRLAAAVQAERRLIACVAEAAREAAASAAPYGRDGAAGTAAGRRSSAAPVALCRSL